MEIDLKDVHSISLEDGKLSLLLLLPDKLRVIEEVVRIEFNHTEGTAKIS